MRPNNSSDLSPRRLSLPGEAFMVPGLLSPGECEALIARAEGVGFAPTGGLYPPRYRDNDRLVLDDAALAGALFPRLAAHLRPLGDARPVGINSRFRLCRYRDGQSFCVHRDGPHVPSATRRSLLTCQIYLNDAAEMRGGHTRFFTEREGGQQLAAIAPERGAAIVFDHGLWHDGEPVTGGTKWVLRTDVMFDVPAVEGPHRGYVWAAFLLSNGQLCTGGRDGTVRRFSLEGGAPVQLAEQVACDGSVLSLVEGPGGAIFIATRDGRVRMSRSGGPFETVLERPTAALSLVSMGDRVLASFADGTMAQAWPHEGRGVAVGRGWLWALCDAGDGRVAAASDDGTVTLVDLHGGPSRPLALGASARALTRAGALLFVGDARGDVHMVAPSSRGLTPLRTTRAHEGAVTCIAAHRDGLVTGGEDQRVVAHDVHGHAQTLTHHDDFVRAVVPLPDGRVASASYDGTVRLSGPITGSSLT